MTERVAVIGAGIAGLTAAYTLKKAGFDPVVFEASDYIGGRIKSFRRQGFLYDVGAFIYLGSYLDAIELMRELNLDSQLEQFDAYGAMPRDGELKYLDFNKPVRTMLTTDYIGIASKLKLLKLMNLLRRHWKDLNYSDATGIAEIDTDTVESYCRRELNEELYQYIAAVVVRGPWLADPATASLGQLLWTMKNFFKPYFYALDEGMDALPKALAAQLDVHLCSTVHGIEKHADRVDVDIESSDGGRRVEQFDRVVITATTDRTLALYPQIDGVQRQFYENTDYICSVNTHIALKRRPENKATYIMASPLENPDLCGVIVDHLKARGRVPRDKGMLTVFCRHQWCVDNLHCSSESILEQVLEFIRPYYGDLSNDVEDFEIGRWPRVVPQMPKGRFKEIAAFQRATDPRDRVQLAGDLEPIGGVNAALVSGKKAARRIIESRR